MPQCVSAACNSISHMHSAALNSCSAVHVARPFACCRRTRCHVCPRTQAISGLFTRPVYASCRPGGLAWSVPTSHTTPGADPSLTTCAAAGQRQPARHPQPHVPGCMQVGRDWRPQAATQDPGQSRHVQQAGAGELAGVQGPVSASSASCTPQRPCAPASSLVQISLFCTLPSEATQRIKSTCSPVSPRVGAGQYSSWAGSSVHVEQQHAHWQASSVNSILLGVDTRAAACWDKPVKQKPAATCLSVPPCVHRWAAAGRGMRRCTCTRPTACA